MKWHKLGNIYKTDNLDEKLVTHTSNPLAVHLHDDIYRIFYSARDKLNRSSVAYIDYDMSSFQLVDIYKQAVFSYGPDGSFYSHGVSIGNCYSIRDNRYILFMGWQINENEHWRGDIGRLRLVNSGELNLEPEQIFLGIDDEDRISLSYPWVIHDDELYKMWYGSTITWDAGNNEMLHVIKYATSSDGENWHKHGLAIPYELGVAQAFSRPSVIKDKTGYHMWYSYRAGDGSKYKIGYASSLDGLSWKRHEKSGIKKSSNGWDSEMVCYPYVFDHKGECYMLYNGNGFGKTGLGLAVLESE